MSVRNSLICQLIKKKFNINQRKTYNPPKNINFIKNKNELLSFFCGIFDGDGCCGFDKNKRVNVLKIQTHISWLSFFKFLMKKLSLNFNIKLFSKGLLL
jgi:hypothetical protein